MKAAKNKLSIERLVFRLSESPTAGLHVITEIMIKTSLLCQHLDLTTDSFIIQGLYQAHFPFLPSGGPGTV